MPLGNSSRRIPSTRSAVASPSYSVAACAVPGEPPTSTTAPAAASSLETRRTLRDPMPPPLHDFDSDPDNAQGAGKLRIPPNAARPQKTDCGPVSWGAPAHHWRPRRPRRYLPKVRRPLPEAGTSSIQVLPGGTGIACPLAVTRRIGLVGDFLTQVPS